MGRFTSFSWQAPRARRITWRRRLPMWVGLMKADGRRPVGLYARIGNQARGVMIRGR